MTINKLFCQDFIDEIRTLRSRLEADCDVHACGQAKELLDRLFVTIDKQQPGFTGELLGYKTRCMDALQIGQNTGSAKYDRKNVSSHIQEALTTLIQKAEDRRARLTYNSSVTQAQAIPASVSDSPDADASGKPWWQKPVPQIGPAIRETPLSQNPAYSPVGSLETAQAEIKRLQLQMQAAETGSSDWKAKYDKMERNLTLVQASAGKLEQELSKLKSDYRELAATKELEKQQALTALQDESQKERQKAQTEQHQLKSAIAAASQKAENAEKSLSEVREANTTLIQKLKTAETQLTQLTQIGETRRQREAEWDELWQAEVDMRQAELNAAREQAQTLADALQKTRTDAERDAAERQAAATAERDGLRAALTLAQQDIRNLNQALIDELLRKSVSPKDAAAQPDAALTET